MMTSINGETQMLHTLKQQLSVTESALQAKEQQYDVKEQKLVWYIHGFVLLKKNVTGNNNHVCNS